MGTVKSAAAGDNDLPSYGADGLFGFNFLDDNLNFKTTAEAIGSLKQPVTTATTSEFVTYFANLFKGLFDAFTYNIGVLYAKVTGTEYYARELQLQNQSLREEINLLGWAIMNIAPVGAGSLEIDLNRVRSDFDTAANLRKTEYLKKLTNILNKLRIEQQPAVNLVEGEKNAHTAAGNSNNSF